jgi:nicotinamidase-related amidase
VNYSHPVSSEPALPATTFTFDISRAALVLTDPQIDFLSPEGVSWGVFGRSVVANDTVAHIGQLLDAAKRSSITVAVSPHYYYPHDRRWTFANPVEVLMHRINMFGRTGTLTLDGFENSGADFLPAYKDHLLDGETIICSPHKIFGPQSNDLLLQLRKRGVTQVILAGMAANLCVEAHLREMIEQGFEVVVVTDATAGPQLPGGVDGHAAALTNFKLLAHATWTTEQAVQQLGLAGGFATVDGADLIHRIEGEIPGAPG